MDVITAECLENCVFLCNRLLNLQDEDSIQIARCLQGEQLENYQHIMRIEREKLEHLKNRLQTLREEHMMLP